MSLKICSLSSGSAGNCVYVASDTTRILIDAGAPLDRVEKSLRVLGAGNTGGLSVLITHTHADHISQLAPLVKKTGAKVYAHHLSVPALPKRIGANCAEFDLAEFTIGDISVTPFQVPHDVPCQGFTLRRRNRAISILTDFGEADESLINQISDSDILFIEANHDEGLVQKGAYPCHLKRRILSKNGHLSNADCAKVCTRLLNHRARQIILGHLSRENNYPELAFNTVAGALREAGAVEGKDVSLEVAPAASMSGLYEVC